MLIYSFIQTIEAFQLYVNNFISLHMVKNADKEREEHFVEDIKIWHISILIIVFSHSLFFLCVVIDCQFYHLLLRV